MPSSLHLDKKLIVKSGGLAGPRAPSAATQAPWPSPREALRVLAPRLTDSQQAQAYRRSMRKAATPA